MAILSETVHGLSVGYRVPGWLHPYESLYTVMLYQISDSSQEEIDISFPIYEISTENHIKVAELGRVLPRPGKWLGLQVTCPREDRVGPDVPLRYVVENLWQISESNLTGARRSTCETTKTTTGPELDDTLTSDIKETPTATFIDQTRCKVS